MVIFPTLDEVKRAAGKANVIPVCKTVLADTETPVSVWMKLYRHDRYSFLLESVTGEDVVARYSFIGGNPFMTFIARERSWVVSGAEERSGTSDPIGALRSIFSRYTVAPVDGVPRFTGGAVGFFSYDSVRLSEAIPDTNPKNDPLDDLFFAFYREVVAFDNKEHRLILIRNIFTDGAPDIETAYRDACTRLELMQQQLLKPLPTNSIDIRPGGEPVSNVKREDFEKAVERCKEYIRAGDIFQVVLSQRFSVPVDAEPFDLYRILRVVNPSPYMYFLRLNDAAVIGASPEMLVRVEEGMVEVRPAAAVKTKRKTRRSSRTSLPIPRSARSTSCWSTSAETTSVA